MNVTVDANEDFLHEVFRLFSVANRAIDEVQEPCLISLDQLLERTLFTAEERRHDGRVVFAAELLSDGGAWKRRPFKCDVSHSIMPPLVLHQGSIR